MDSNQNSSQTFKSAKKTDINNQSIMVLIPEDQLWWEVRNRLIDIGISKDEIAHENTKVDPEDNEDVKLLYLPFKHAAIARSLGLPIEELPLPFDTLKNADLEQLKLSLEAKPDVRRYNAVVRTIENKKQYLPKETSKTQHISDVLGSMRSKIDERFCKYQSTKQVELFGISTGFTKLDNLIDGFQPGHLITIGARPGIGKTWSALNFIYQISIRQRKKVLFISLEMSAEAITYRLLGILSGINPKIIKRGSFSPEESKEIDFAYEVLEKSLLHIVDDASLSDLENLKNFIDQCDLDYDLIIIDYIGLMKTNAKDRVSQVTEVTRYLKLLAGKKKRPVIELAQVNRGGDKPGMPKLSDLRESGSIEQDSDIVIFIHSPYLYDTNADPNLVEFGIAKNREGEGGTIPFKKDSVWRLKEDTIQKESTNNPAILAQYTSISKIASAQKSSGKKNPGISQELNDLVESVVLEQQSL